MVVVVFLLVAVDPSGQVQVFFTPYIGTQLYSIFEWVSQGFASRHPLLTPYTVYIYRHTIVHIFEWGSQGFASRHPDVAIRRTKCKIPIYSNTEKGQKSTVTMQTNVKINTLDIRKLKMLFYPTFS